MRLGDYKGHDLPAIPACSSSLHSLFHSNPHLFQPTNPQSQLNYHHHEVLDLCRCRPRRRRYRSTRHQPRREAGWRRRKWDPRRGPLRTRGRGRLRRMVSSTERKRLNELELTVRPFPTLPYPTLNAPPSNASVPPDTPRGALRWPPRFLGPLAAVQRSRT